MSTPGIPVMQPDNLQLTFATGVDGYEDRPILLLIIYSHNILQLFLCKFPAVLNLSQCACPELRDLHGDSNIFTLLVFQP